MTTIQVRYRNDKNIAGYIGEGMLKHHTPYIVEYENARVFNNKSEADIFLKIFKLDNLYSYLSVDRIDEINIFSVIIETQLI